MKNQLLIITATTLTISCGSGGGSKKSDDNPIQKRTQTEELKEQKLHDQNCTPRESIADLSVFSWDGNSIQTKSLEDSSINYQNGAISGQAVAETIIGEKSHSVIHCSYGFDGSECDKMLAAQGPKTFTGGSPLVVCDSESSERDSVATIALTALYHVETASQFYYSLDPKFELEKAKLTVLPEDKTTVKFDDAEDLKLDQVEFFKSDNASFRGGDEPTFFVWPHSKEYSNRASFWEVPFIFAHELGHHIFSTYVSSNSDSDLLGIASHHIKKTSNPFEKVEVVSKTPKLQEIHDYQNAAGSSTMDTETKYAFQSFGALNEGFSDLFAYYTYQEQKQPLKGIYSLETDRDIASPLFKNGKPKVMDYDKSSDFFYGDSDDPYNDIHLIGAIIARTLDELMSTKALDNKEKMNLLLEWLDQELQFNGQGRWMVLGETLGNFLDLISEDGKLTGEQCDIMQERFPATSFKLENLYVADKSWSCS